jgi:hypothetical protein
MFKLLGDLASLRLGALVPAFKAALHLYVGAGILLLPVAPLLLERLNGGWRWPVAAFSIAVAVTAACFVFEQPALSGLSGDILATYGVGPLLILGGVPHAPFASVALTLAGTFLTTVLMMCLMPAVWAQWRNGSVFEEQSRIPAFFILAGLGVYAPHGLTYGPLMDRYWITPTILISIGAFALMSRSPDGNWSPSRLVFALSALLVGSGIALSSAMTQDFFSWQRARYALVDRAFTEFGATTETLAAGFEYDNLMRIIDKPDAARSIKTIGLEIRPLYLAHPWWPHGDVIATESVDRILPFAPEVVTQRRADGSEGN